MTGWQYKAVFVWVVMSLVVTILVMVAAVVSGSDPSYCPSCPEVWKQQPWAP